MTDAPSVEEFDQWYSGMEHAPLKDAIVQRHLGLPPYLLSTSLLPWEGIAEVIAGLHLSSMDVLMDLACGRGGYGMEVAHRTGAELIGVDYSGVAVQLATEQAARLGREADFRVGDMAATGLAAHSVDGVMCIDAIQFAPDQDAAYRELHRVLRPGGRVVLTCWEATNPDTEAIPQRLRDVDLHGGLAAAGFTEIAVMERPDWLERERAMWEEAAGLDPGDDPALRSLNEEAVAALAETGNSRRAIASATA